MALGLPGLLLALWFGLVGSPYGITIWKMSWKPPLSSQGYAQSKMSSWSLLEAVLNNFLKIPSQKYKWSVYWSNKSLSPAESDDTNKSNTSLYLRDKTSPLHAWSSSHLTEYFVSKSLPLPSFLIARKQRHALPCLPWGPCPHLGNGSRKETAGGESGRAVDYYLFPWEQVRLGRGSSGADFLHVWEQRLCLPPAPLICPSCARLGASHPYAGLFRLGLC